MLFYRHIIPKLEGGDDHPHNFLTVCWEHHNMIHNMAPIKITNGAPNIAANRLPLGLLL